MRKVWGLFIVLTLVFALAACGGQEAEPAEETSVEEAAAVEESSAEEEAAPEEESSVEEEAAAEESSVEEEEMAEDEAAPTGEGTFLERAMAGEFAGGTVELLGVMVEEDGLKMEEAVKPFEEATGIDVNYIGTKEFETQINVRVDAGDPPDIANISQPGLLATFAQQGHVVDVSEFLPAEQLQETYIQSWLDMATMEGPDGPIMTGVWHRVAPKSYVWYPKARFDEAGYEVPETWDELMTLTQTIADDGDPAWCVGIESGAATGWVATDWIENIMLRTTSLENYDKWVTNELPFASPEVKNAAETMAAIWLNDDYVFGGVPSIVTTFIGDSPVPMFTDPPGCWFHVQAPWIQSFFGEGLEAGVDYDFFYMPPIDEAYGKPVLVGGDIMAMFNDTPEAKALMEFFSTGAGVEQWVKLGGAISPHKDSDLDWYTTEMDRKVAQVLLEADSVRFDASDLMPGEVGAGSFWKATTDWISGSTDLDTALAEIDASWPGDATSVESAVPEGEEAEETAAASIPEILERAYAGEFTGGTVELLGVMVEEDGLKMEEAVKPFEEATGIDVNYIGTKEFETQINVRVDAGDPPDIANISQPGLLATFAQQGHVVDVTEFLPEEQLQETYIQSWLDMATMEGPDGPIMTGVWHRVAPKSYVWYPKARFDEAGYEVPETWDELMTLTQTIADDGDPAWCVGIESGAATGWVATDWMENIMLRTTSLENYDKWVAGELPFASPEVKNAAETMAAIWLNDDYVFGGVPSIVTTFIGDSPVPMFTDPPGCWFHVQAPWIQSFFGEGLEPGVDYDFFYMPPIDEAYGKPVLAGGDIMAMFNDTPEAQALMAFFSTGAGVEEWVKLGGAISPHKDSDLDWYTTEMDRKVAQVLLEADSVRFDASDLMPGEVGAGSFWKATTDWISGSTDLDTALAEIDASWPAE